MSTSHKPRPLSYAAPATDPAPGPTPTRLLLSLALSALLLRLLLATLSYGTNDYRFYLIFAHLALNEGMSSVMTTFDVFNLTPAMTGYSIAILGFYHATNISFALLFKLPLIAADAATMLLLWKTCRQREGARAALLAVTGFAWSLNSLLVTGYHCNTDPFYAFLSLLAVYLLDTPRRPVAAGLALAAAINVKLIPVLLIPGFLAACRDRREALRFLAALSLGAIPFLVMLALYRGLFFEQVINYNSQLTNWGLSFFLRRLAESAAFADAGATLVEAYRAYGKYLMLLAIAAAALESRRRNWDLYRTAAVAFSLFLILTPGFGVQYTVAVVPLLFAVSRPFAAAYSTAAGIYLATLYIYFSKHTFPWESFFPGPDPLGPAYLGLIAWTILLAFVVRQFATRSPILVAPPAP
jgi:hypothetical protein